MRANVTQCKIDTLIEITIGQEGSADWSNKMLRSWLFLKYSHPLSSKYSKVSLVKFE